MSDGAARLGEASSRADLHCHSRASERAGLGTQRALGLPECATPPEEVYELAKRRGMDFVTITDHDTVGGALEIADRPDVFIGVELTARFRGEPRAVHVLCWDITVEDHLRLQERRADVESCAAYLHEHGVACALAHPFSPVEEPLTGGHLRRLADLFPLWETRNGARHHEINQPAAIWAETRGASGIGGSDDHAGIDVGRTHTSTPRAASPGEFLELMRTGAGRAGGEEGGIAKWAHTALGLATRSLGHGGSSAPDPLRVLKIAQGLAETQPESPPSVGLGPGDARDLLRAWLDAVGLAPGEEALLALLQDDGFSHEDLHRRARRAHERALRNAVGRALADEVARGEYGAAALGLFGACLPIIPYVPPAAILAKEKAKVSARREARPRVALVAEAVGGMHGVTRSIDEIRERGVPGYDVDVIGTDASVDRRLPAVAEVDIPFYRGLAIGIPSIPALVDMLAEESYDVIHLTSPGPAGIVSALAAKLLERPIVFSYHTELAAYAGLRTEDERLASTVEAVLAAAYGVAHVVLSPSEAADASLASLGIEHERIARWDRGVDLSRFGPHLAERDSLPGELTVLYAGRLTVEKGIDLLAEAFLLARAKDQRLHLVLAGGGPEEDRLRTRLAGHATFLGWLEGEELARAYASADVFLFASRTDTFGQVILEAQASGLPVVAVAEGGPAELVENGRTGLLRPPDAGALAQALVALAAAPELRQRLGDEARLAASERTWERALSLLADGYGRALEQGGGQVRRAA